MLCRAVVLLVACVVAGSLPAHGFEDAFGVDRTIEETGRIDSSAHPEWWVSSGGRFESRAGIGRTLLGELPSDDRWRREYAASNPLDTDDGYHPQNLFRAVARRKWTSFTQRVRFRIRRTNLTDTPNRDAWSGILLFFRYQDQNNLYYAGLRMDGAVVVKKKLAGTYTTLGYRKLYAGSYDRDRNPNLLPGGTWIGMRGDIATTAVGTVLIRLSIEDPSLGSGWQPVLEVEDSGGGPGGAAITAAGHAGIRSDFMDVEFDDYSATENGGTPSPAPTATPSPVAATPTPAPKATPNPFRSLERAFRRFAF